MADPTEIIVLGTIHSAHNENEHYSPDRLREILLALRPAAFCVELYSKFFDEDGTIRQEFVENSDCPEVCVATDAANELGVRQIPFDIEGRNEFFEQTGYFQREKRCSKLTNEWYENLRAREPDCVEVLVAELTAAACASQHYMTRHCPPEVINSEDLDEIIEIRHRGADFMASVCGRDPALAECKEFHRLASDYWQERNRVMADNIARIASDFQRGMLVVVTGCEHRRELRKLLPEKPAIVLREFWEVLKPSTPHSQRVSGTSLSRM